MKPTTTRAPQNWREGRRLRAWELAQQGWPQRKIAEALGVSHGAVGQWISRAKQFGIEALRHRPGPGPKPKLTAEQRAQLPALLARSAEAFGFRGQVWTAKRVAIVIEREFGVRYHPTHVSRLLKALRWSPQKPIRRATQRDEGKIAAWYAERWPTLKRGRKATGEPLSG
jgi:transposase